jgi:hypothetical protein
MAIKKTSEEWAEELKISGLQRHSKDEVVESPDITVDSPDGWDEQYFDEDAVTPITKEQFKAKVQASDCTYYKPIEEVFAD